MAEVGDEETDLDRVLATVHVHRHRGVDGEGRGVRRRAGRSSSNDITALSERCSAGTAASRSTRRATGSSPRSTAPRAASGARWRSLKRCGLGLEVRAGVHTGEVETIDGKVGGIAVNIGARVARLAGLRGSRLANGQGPGVGSGLAFEDAGEHELKGVPDRWRLGYTSGEVGRSRTNYAYRQKGRKEIWSAPSCIRKSRGRIK